MHVIYLKNTLIIKFILLKEILIIPTPIDSKTKSY